MVTKLGPSHSGFENRMLRAIIETKGAELTVGYRKLHNKVFAVCTILRIYYNDQIEEVEMGEAFSTCGIQK
jgi:hypothetical protein